MKEIDHVIDKLAEKALAEKDAEISQLHLNISRMAEAHQTEMRKQIGYIQHKVDQLTEIIDNYSSLISIHKNWEEKTQ